MIKRVLLLFSFTALTLLALSQLSSANPILLNSGFETAGANPGGATNWYGYTYSADGGTGEALISQQMFSVAISVSYFDRSAQQEVSVQHGLSPTSIPYHQAP
jgi:hypothetical protein